MLHPLNDKGDNYLTEIPGCPEKRIIVSLFKLTLVLLSLLIAYKNMFLFLLLPYNCLLHHVQDYAMTLDFAF